MHLSRVQTIFKGRHFQKELLDRKMSLQRFVIGTQDWLVALFSSFHDSTCLNWQLYFWSFQMGSSISTKGGKGMDPPQVWRSTCFLKAPCLNCKLMLMREAAPAGVEWKKGVLVHHSDQTHTHLIEKRSCFWLPLAHSPDELTCGFPINCCCLWLLWFKRGADYVFHHINSNETYDEVSRCFPGPAALPSRPWMESPSWLMCYSNSVAPP